MKTKRGSVIKVELTPAQIEMTDLALEEWQLGIEDLDSERQTDRKLQRIRDRLADAWSEAKAKARKPQKA